MNRKTFFIYHGLFLALFLLPPKWLKFSHLTPFPSFLTIIYLLFLEILLISALEFLIFWILKFLKRKPRMILMSFWGFILFPLLVVSIADHRFFSSTGSFLHWDMFWYGFTHFPMLLGLLHAEMTWWHWILIIGFFPLGLFWASWGWSLSKNQIFQPILLTTKQMSFLIFPLVLVTFNFFPETKLKNQKVPLEIQNNLYARMAKELFSWDKEQNQSFGKINYAHFIPLKWQSNNPHELKNIVFIILESVRTDATTPYPPHADITPFLNSLAKTGVMVESAHAVMPHTTKSLVSILCGLPPDIRFALTETSEGGIIGPCLPHLLRPLGYKSAFFQPAIQSFENRTGLIQNMGFDHFVAKENVDSNKFEEPNYLGMEENALISPVMGWVDNQKNPFFLSILTLSSHHNYQTPRHFSKKQYEENGRKNWSNYLNTIRYQDLFIKKVYEEFSKRNLLDETLFVILGDHGEAFGEHNTYFHDSNPYQHGLHIPLILHNPILFPKHQRIKGLRQTIDLVPTLAELFHFRTVQGNYRGHSLFQPVPNRILFSSCWLENQCYVRFENNEKFIYNTQGKQYSDFFNIKKDPTEQNNLIFTLPQKRIDQYIKEIENWKNEINGLYHTHRNFQKNTFVSNEKPSIKNPLNTLFQEKLTTKSHGAMVSRGTIRAIGYDLNKFIHPKKKQKLTLIFETVTNLNWHWKDQLVFFDSKGKLWPLQYQTTLKQELPFFSWNPGQFQRIEFQFKLPTEVPLGPGNLCFGIQNKMGWIPPLGNEVFENEPCLNIPVTVKS